MSSENLPKQRIRRTLTHAELPSDSKLPCDCQLPRDKGTYALVLHARTAFRIQVGKLGRLCGELGYFVYLGSAFGAGGIAARVAHHMAASGKCHWHIDYLRRVAALEEVWFSTAGRRLEHDWAKILGGMPTAKIPLPGFGASDCHCPSHLYYFSELPSPDLVMQVGGHRHFSCVQIPPCID